MLCHILNENFLGGIRAFRLCSAKKIFICIPSADSESTKKKFFKWCSCKTTFINATFCRRQELSGQWGRFLLGWHLSFLLSYINTSFTIFMILYVWLQSSLYLSLWIFSLQGFKNGTSGFMGMQCTGRARFHMRPMSFPFQENSRKTYLRKPMPINIHPHTSVSIMFIRCFLFLHLVGAFILKILPLRCHYQVPRSYYPKLQVLNLEVGAIKLLKCFYLLPAHLRR